MFIIVAESSLGHPSCPVFFVGTQKFNDKPNSTFYNWTHDLNKAAKYSTQEDAQKIMGKIKSGWISTTEEYKEFTGANNASI